MLPIINVALMNLLLSSDNVLIIALFGQRITGRRRMFALFVSLIASVVLQLGILFIVSFLFRITFLQSLFGVLIVYMAFHLLHQKEPEEDVKGGSTMWGAVWKIVIGNLMMSFENEATLITLSGGNVWIAWIGLLATSPIIFFGSHFIAWLLQKFDFILYLGAVVLVKIGVDLVFTVGFLKPYADRLPWLFTGLFALYTVWRYYHHQQRVTAR